jgi:cytochrome c peroxidase
LITEGSHAGDGRQNFNKSPFVRGFTMDEDEKRAMLAFLESLTDETFLSDPRFYDPWQAQ